MEVRDKLGLLSVRGGIHLVRSDRSIFSGVRASGKSGMVQFCLFPFNRANWSLYGAYTDN